MDAIETFDSYGNSVSIYSDEDAQNPRTECDHFGHMICFHGRHNLGDEHKLSIEEALEIEERTDVVCIALYLYDHSGITMRASTKGNPFTCPWDSGKVGIIYVTHDEIKKEYGAVDGTSIEKAAKLLLAEVQEYDQYLTGDVYGYVVTDKDGEEIDSCWGIYGLEEARKQAKEVSSPVSQ